jgi:hypothetical protein
MEELMRKDLLSKLLNNNVNISTRYLSSHSCYSTTLELHKSYETHISDWIISRQNTGKTISESIDKTHSDLILKIVRLIDQIDTNFSINCNFAIEDSKIMTSLKIYKEEKCDGDTIIWIYHKIKSEESAELLLIQAKKFIIGELTKIKESIS